MTTHVEVMVGAMIVGVTFCGEHSSHGRFTFMNIIMRKCPIHMLMVKIMRAIPIICVGLVPKSCLRVLCITWQTVPH